MPTGASARLPDPDALLAVARYLARPGGDTFPDDARLRRAVSTAYHALFHTVLRAAADRFAGSGNNEAAAYRLLYRGSDHMHMRKLCEDPQSTTSKEKYRDHLNRQSLSKDMRDFASSLPLLQKDRHRAGCDPAARLTASNVDAIIDSSEAAIQAFNRTDPAEKADVLALLLVGTRS